MTVIVHITPKSSNKKTGPIPVTITSDNSCPSVCPLRDQGCYAQSGPLAIHWRKTSNGERGNDWDNLLDTVKAFPEGQLWRHNQAGDLPHTDQVIDAALVGALVAANEGRRGFTYTHHDMALEGNVEVVKAANEGGFAVNLSANDPAHADELVKLGIAPVVTVLGEYAEGVSYTPEGNRITVCPAAQRDDVSCATCKLCAKTDRKVIIGFPVHGARRRTAARNLGL